MGCFDYLVKPVNIEQLLFSIDRAKLFFDTELELKNRGVEQLDIKVEVGKGLQEIREKAEKKPNHQNT